MYDTSVSISVVRFKDLLFIPLEPSTSSHNHTKKAEDYSMQLVKFSKGLDINSAFNEMTSAIEDFLSITKFSKLKRACVERINTFHSNLPRKLIPKIKATTTLEELLQLFAESEYWNWFDIRLLEALTHATGLPEAKEWLEDFKEIYYFRKITEFIPYDYIRPFKEYIQLDEKFDKHPIKQVVLN